MSGNRRRKRTAQRMDGTESGEELIRQRLFRLQMENARLWGQWQSNIVFLGWLVLFYAIYHTVNDFIHHYSNNEHLPFLQNISKCIFDIFNHLITVLNAYLVRNYIKIYPEPGSKKWLKYAWIASTFECFCIFLHKAFPMGTFYLMISMSMVYFIDYQSSRFQETIRDFKKMK